MYHLDISNSRLSRGKHHSRDIHLDVCNLIAQITIALSQNLIA
jgi:hypothetical protein